MKSRMVAVLALVALVALVACKDKEPEPPKGAEAFVAAMKKIAKAAAKGTKPEATPGDSKNPLAGLKALSDLGKKLATGMQKALGGKARGPVVNWRALKAFLPDSVGGWSARRPVRGSTGGMAGFRTSRVSRYYRSGTRRLRIEIIDTSLASFMRAGFAFAQGFDQDTDSMIRKGTKIAGHPTVLTYRKRSKSSRAQSLVGDRFLVKVRVSPAEKPDEATGILTQLDLKGIGALKR